MDLFGGIEAGGTKFVCVVGTGPDDLRAESRFPTTGPEETLQKAVEFFKEQENSSGSKIKAIGIAAFGPIDLNHSSPTYGYVTLTPKPGWKYADITGTISRGLQIPAALDTDVNAAAIGEGRWGAGMGLDDFIYLTIGTGIGGGAIVNGKPLHGLVHPEMGHVILPHDLTADPFPGVCPFHDNCFEGLASGPALNKRLGQPAETLPLDHPVWDLEASYIASALEIYICTLSPQKIILGGGVMQQKHLFPLIHDKVKNILNGYVQSPAILDRIEDYIVPPGLGTRSGSLGALALAMMA